MFRKNYENRVNMLSHVRTHYITIWQVQNVVPRSTQIFINTENG